MTIQNFLLIWTSSNCLPPDKTIVNFKQGVNSKEKVLNKSK